MELPHAAFPHRVHRRERGSQRAQHLVQLPGALQRLRALLPLEVGAADIGEHHAVRQPGVRQAVGRGGAHVRPRQAGRDPGEGARTGGGRGAVDLRRARPQPARDEHEGEGLRATAELVRRSDAGQRHEVGGDVAIRRPAALARDPDAARGEHHRVRDGASRPRRSDRGCAAGRREQGAGRADQEGVRLRQAVAGAVYEVARPRGHGGSRQVDRHAACGDPRRARLPGQQPRARDLVVGARVRRGHRARPSRRVPAGPLARQARERDRRGGRLGAPLLGWHHPHHHLLRAAELVARDGRCLRRRNSRVPAAHGATDDRARADPARCDRARGAVGCSRHPRAGVRARAAREGPRAPPGLYACGEERGTADHYGPRSAVRLPARRLGAGRDGVFVAGYGLPAESGDLPARHPGVARRDSGARDVLRPTELAGRRAANVHRPADRSALMSSIALPTEAGVVVGPQMSYWRTVAWRLSRDRATLVACSLLLLVVLSAVLAPWISPHDPNAGSIRLRLAPVGAPSHVLGIDEQGRDMLSRLLWGGRMTLLAGLAPVVVAFAFGTVLGVIAGYTGGIVNTLVMRTMDIFYAFPAVLLAIAISGALGPGLANTVIALSIVFVPRVVRVAESATVQVQGLEYIAAARASGAGVGAIVRHHLLANVLGPILVFSSTQVSLSIILAAGLSFLGLGVTPPAAEWGLMLNTLRQSIYVNALVPALPGLAIFVTSMAFNLLSDGLRDAMEIRG